MPSGPLRHGGKVSPELEVEKTGSPPSDGFELSISAYF